MMKDKPKVAWQSRFSTFVLIGGVIAATMLRFAIGPGLLPFSVALVGG